MAITSSPLTDHRGARQRAPQIAARPVAPEPRGWTSWITTTDHKRIGILYMFTTFVFFLLGGVEALLMRLQLGAPDNTLVSPRRTTSCSRCTGRR